MTDAKPSSGKRAGAAPISRAGEVRERKTLRRVAVWGLATTTAMTLWGTITASAETTRRDRSALRTLASDAVSTASDLAYPASGPHQVVVVRRSFHEFQQAATVAAPATSGGTVTSASPSAATSRSATSSRGSSSAAGSSGSSGSAARPASSGSSSGSSSSSSSGSSSGSSSASKPAASAPKPATSSRGS